MSEIPYGTEVSTEPALSRPGAAEALHKAYRTGRGMMSGCTAVCLVLAVTGFTLAALASGGFSVLGAFGTLGSLIGALVIWSNGRGYRKARTILRAYTWQEWPARFVSYDEDGVDREAIDLVGGDGRTVYRMEVEVFAQTFMGDHTDGAPLWFAGDARFGGVLAAPGAQTWTTLATREQPGRERGSELADRTARETGLMPKGWQSA